ncbi:hypothetical protein NL676_033422 [Syzygium grande]|nr:hypothetical protein NL676_033422 [Syzygium grande]
MPMEFGCVEVLSERARDNERSSGFGMLLVSLGLCFYARVLSPPLIVAALRLKGSLVGGERKTAVNMESTMKELREVRHSLGSLCCEWVISVERSSLQQGTCFYRERERDAHYLRGLLPPTVASQHLQEKKLLHNLRQYQLPLQKDLRERNERLFYKLLIDNVEELLHVIYTPTVGEACQTYGSIFRRPEDLLISLKERSKVLKALKNWPERSIRVVVVTDGERILGLGDLGCQGMGIPVGKLALFTALGGVHPSACLSVTIDMGMNNEDLLKDEFYIGLRQRRATGRTELAVIIMEKKFTYSLRILQTTMLLNCLQSMGTAAAVLAGLLAALKVVGGSLADHNFMFFGAGGDWHSRTHSSRDVKAGRTPVEETRKNIWLVDSKGLIVNSRKDSLQHFKKLWAHEHEPVEDLLGAVKALKPTILIGSAGVGRAFTKEVIEAMTSYTKRPLIMALSNPTSKSECTAEEPYTWSKANNAYIFPGFGLGSVISWSLRVHDQMLLAASGQVSQEDFEKGLISPPLRNIRKISAQVAANVAKVAYDLGLATRLPRPGNLVVYAESCMYGLVYRNYR